jgi:hypothetical protein
VTTGLWDHALAAVVDINLTVSALDSLPDNAIEESATVVTPSGLVVGGALELVGPGLLHVKRTVGLAREAQCLGITCAPMSTREAQLNGPPPPFPFCSSAHAY